MARLGIRNRLAWLAALWLAAGLAQAAALKIQAVVLTVADLDQSVAFYRDALDFRELGREVIAEAGHDQAIGVFGSRVLRATLRLGDETLLLEQYLSPPGAPFPADSRSQDRWFQHFAIVVSDMDKAWARLTRHPVQAISLAPQTLPESNVAAAGIRAYKFRDPDGHPLELIQFPPGKGRDRWHRTDHRSDSALFLGIDHSAVTVAATDASLGFWRDLLGLKLAGQSLNSGITQAHLDAAPGAVVQVTGLRPESADGPGLEFLQYLSPADGRSTPREQRPNDLAHARLVLEVDDVDQLADTLTQARARFVSPRVVCKPGGEFGKRLMVQDPDGHAVMLIERQRADEPC